MLDASFFFGIRNFGQFLNLKSCYIKFILASHLEKKFVQSILELSKELNALESNIIFSIASSSLHILLNFKVLFANAHHNLHSKEHSVFSQFIKDGLPFGFIFL